MNNKRNALGKGLSALLENSETDVTTTNDLTDHSRVVGSIATIPVDQIDTNPFQPRTQFEKDALEELAGSIKEHGIVQPVTVRKMGYDKYQLISGERRLRASKLANLTEIPAYIRIANDQQMLEIALVENIQRTDLDAIEIAISYKRLLEECKLTQEALSQKVGKQRATISNYLRLLKLPAEIQLGIRAGKISMGHARALINIENEDIQRAIYDEILKDNLSVRQVEQLARNANFLSKSTASKTKNSAPSISFELQKLKEDLSGILSAKVEIRKNTKGSGKIVIPFASEEDLTRIIEILEK